MTTPRIMAVGASATRAKIAEVASQLGWQPLDTADIDDLRAWENVDAVFLECKADRIESDRLVERAKLLRPGIACIAVSTTTTPQAWTRGAHGAVQVDSGPHAYQRAYEHAREVLATIAGPAVQRLIGHPEQLPVVPRVFWELRRLAAKPGTTVDEIASTIARDPGLATQVLKLANSVTFGASRRIASLQQAVSLMGLDALSTLVLSTSAFALFAIRSRVVSLERFQQYSVRVGRVCQAFLPEDADNAFAAGLLHDIGSLVLTARFPSEIASIVGRCALQGEPTMALERELIGVGHAEVGAYLLDAWHLPFPVIEAVAAHEHPSSLIAQAVPLVAAAHAAQALMAIVACGMPDSVLDVEYIERCGLVGRLPAWRALVEKEATLAFY